MGQGEEGIGEEGEGAMLSDATSPASVPKVFILVLDAGIDDTSKNVVLLPVVAQLTQPVEVIL